MSNNFLDQIIKISGKPGLYKILSKTTKLIIAESINNNQRISVILGKEINLLSEIKIYGVNAEIPLIEVFQKIFQHESGLKIKLNPKSSKNDLVSYFHNILSEIDETRVYPSDFKKIIQWYNLLLEKKILKFQIKESSSEDIKKNKK